MTNPFNIDNLINNAFFPLTKGGPGSGRYPKGSDFSDYVSMGNQMHEARKIIEHLEKAGKNADWLKLEAQHRNIARALEQASKELEGEKGVKRLKDAIDKAAELHRTASIMHSIQSVHGGVVDNSDTAISDSKKALAASLKVDKINYGY